MTHDRTRNRTIQPSPPDEREFSSVQATLRFLHLAAPADQQNLSFVATASSSRAAEGYPSTTRDAFEDLL